MEVRRIKREDIDKLKWDSCVHYANNGNIYGYSWYLDNVAENWEGLVEGDYESVLPLIWNDKLLGYKQIYQPFLAQQSGLYSVNVLSPKRIQTFIEAIPEEYRKVTMHLNERNKLKSIESYEITPRTNLVLDLNQPYEILEKNYSKNHKRNLKKARSYDNVINGNIRPEKLMEQYKTYQGVKIKDFKEKHYHAAHRIIYNALHRGRGFMSGITSKEGEPLASAFFTVSHNRFILLFPSTTPLGRERNAMHLLLDMFIQTNAGRPMLLDFEGSSVKSIARFYSGFGAQERPYFQLKRNNLPFWMKPILNR
jgi:hypothetical protein